MRHLVTLQLPRRQKSLDYVKHIPGFANLDIDEDYGVITISPKRHLYGVRVLGDLDADHLKMIEPRVKEVYGDMPIALH